jgi:hypothetical protein
VTDTGFAAIPNYNGLNRQRWSALGIGRTPTQLSAMSGAGSMLETSRRMQEMIRGPVLAFDRPFQVEVRPVSLRFERAFAMAAKPIIDQQRRSLADLVRLSLPSSLLDSVRALESSSIVRIQELSRIALAGSRQQAFYSFGFDWTRQMSGFDLVANAVQAAGVAANPDIAAPGGTPTELPEWLTGFAARVRALPASEQRALALNLLALAVMVASLFVSGPAADVMRASSVLVSVATYVNHLSKLYEGDKPDDDEDESAE